MLHTTTLPCVATSQTRSRFVHSPSHRKRATSAVPGTCYTQLPCHAWLLHKRGPDSCTRPHIGNAQPQRYQAHATHNYPAMRGYFTNEVPIRALALTSETRNLSGTRHMLHTTTLPCVATSQTRSRFVHSPSHR